MFCKLETFKSGGGGAEGGRGQMGDKCSFAQKVPHTGFTCKPGRIDVSSCQNKKKHEAIFDCGAMLIAVGKPTIQLVSP